MDPSAFTTVLGHPRVLDESLTDPRRRVLAFDGDTIVGVAVYEPLFGRQAEGAIAVQDGSAGGVVSYLFDGLVELARQSEVTVLRYVLGARRQRSLASHLIRSAAPGRLHADRLELRLEPWAAPTD